MLPDDWQTEKLLSIAKAARRLKKSPQVMYSYVHQGVSVGEGRRVYLEVAKIGSTLRTSVEALNRFVERCSPSPKGQPTRTPAEAARAGKRAGDVLRAELGQGRRAAQVADG